MTSGLNVSFHPRSHQQPHHVPHMDCLTRIEEPPTPRPGNATTFTAPEAPGARTLHEAAFLRMARVRMNIMNQAIHVKQCERCLGPGREYSACARLTHTLRIEARLPSAIFLLYLKCHLVTLVEAILPGTFNSATLSLKTAIA